VRSPGQCDDMEGKEGWAGQEGEEAEVGQRLLGQKKRVLGGKKQGSQAEGPAPCSQITTKKGGAGESAR